MRSSWRRGPRSARPRRCGGRWRTGSRAPAVAEIRLVRAVAIQAVRGTAPSTAPGDGGFMKETSADISSALARSLSKGDRDRGTRHDGRGAAVHPAAGLARSEGPAGAVGRENVEGQYRREHRDQDDRHRRKAEHREMRQIDDAREQRKGKTRSPSDFPGSSPARRGTRAGHPGAGRRPAGPRPQGRSRSSRPGKPGRGRRRPSGPRRRVRKFGLGARSRRPRW